MASSPTVGILGALLGIVAAAGAQVTVDAGDNQILLPGTPLTLSPSLSGLTPLHYWTADGNNAFENQIVEYNSDTGVAALLLEDSGGQPMVWPTDLLRVGGTIYGVDRWFRQLFTRDDTTGIVTPIGPQFANGEALNALAYDAGNDILYSVDTQANELVEFDRATGATTYLFDILVSYRDTTGLAFHDASGLIYAYDEFTDALYTIDPDTEAQTTLHTLTKGANEIYDELTFMDGELYAMAWHVPTGVGQLRHVDVGTGAVTDVGPTVNDVSAHSLIIHTMPECTEWTQVSGPSGVVFTDPSDPNTDVVLPRPGVYVLELSVLTEPDPVTDTVTLTAIRPGVLFEKGPRGPAPGVTPSPF